MSEQQPLLLPSQDQDVEQGDDGGRVAGEKGHITRWRDSMAEVLESRPWHYIVLTDAACVLADLAYTVLSDTCVPPEGPDAPLWLNGLSHLSLGITTLFLVEIPVTLWAMGFSHYNPFGSVPHAGLHLFDSTIILVTFVLEVVLRGRERELAGLLVILRLWRLVKLVGGVAVGATEIDDDNEQLLTEAREERDRALTQLKEAQAEIRTLRARLGFTDSTE
ncbi:hypothetical protein BDY19DRAFT_881844 [Irpex rosettiformis]|uniref:Uncharacterized protein n=1 Tax=Irpex rosettiformis TaxID=378272 RepID=A0ACB8UGW7_9APHY|nr:hypothetical protein BDY19DRAFT_881844 [Irpex rosettiformis]